ncbi:MAG: hypothetical protein KGO52_00865 [Nitrospirota bacterium]|nr:hypothetical protein [Nitrospirota bacterium]MDE3241252.1 hypothetical protein [Nitrospirota bacterium]
MSGPFSLRYVHLFVGEKAPGSFILSRNGRLADYVGVSGEDVAGAIRRAAQQASYRYFWFAVAETAEDAAQLGHTWYHRYRPTDNSAPPAEFGRSSWQCTADGCATCAMTQSRQ